MGMTFTPSEMYGKGSRQTACSHHMVRGVSYVPFFKGLHPPTLLNRERRIPRRMSFFFSADPSCFAGDGVSRLLGLCPAGSSFPR